MKAGMTEDARPLNAVGVFIMAGGFTLGVRDHFNVLAHLDESWYGVKSAQLNNPGLPVYVGPKLWPLRELAEQRVDFVYCNPPCALFSQAGATMRGGNDAWKTDPRQSCWRNCFVAGEALQPKVFALESVVRAFTAGREFVDQFAGMAHEMGYAVTHLLIDTKNHGMAQRRKRYFLVAHRVELDLELDGLPQPKVKDVLAGMSGGPGYVTPWRNLTHEALVPYLKPHESFKQLWQEYYPDFESYERNAQGGVIGRPRTFIHRVDPDDVIATITGDYFVHPYQDRFLGVNELKVLNGFPEDYYLEGNPGGHGSLLARGVCPPAAEWLARKVREGINAGRPAEAGTTRVVDLR